MIAAVVLIVDFFIMPWVNWESKRPSDVVWASHPMPAVTLANKADLYGLWLIPICAAAVLLAKFTRPDQVKQSAVMLGSGIVSAIGLLYFFGTMAGTSGRENLAFLAQTVTANEISGAMFIPIVCAVLFLYSGIRLRRAGQ